MVNLFRFCFQHHATRPVVDCVILTPPVPLSCICENPVTVMFHLANVLSGSKCDLLLTVTVIRSVSTLCLAIHVCDRLGHAKR